jgi:hypothetical protein
VVPKARTSLRVTAGLWLPDHECLGGGAVNDCPKRAGSAAACQLRNRLQPVIGWLLTRSLSMPTLSSASSCAALTMRLDYVVEICGMSLDRVYVQPAQLGVTMLWAIVLSSLVTSYVA